MNSRKKRQRIWKFPALILTAFITILIIFAGIFIFLKTQNYRIYKVDNQTEVHKMPQSSSKQTIYPTIYIDGSAGNGIPSSWMIDEIQAQNLPNVKPGLKMTVNVFDKNKMTITGNIGANDKYPMINFCTGQNSNKKGTDRGDLYAAGLKVAIQYLTEHYNVPYMNMMGYSSGGTGAIYYMIDYSSDKNLPPVKKFLSVDGEYNKSINTYLDNGQDLTDVILNGPIQKSEMYNYIEQNYKKISPSVQMAFLESTWLADKQTDSAVPWSDTFSIYHLFSENKNPIYMSFYSSPQSHAYALKQEPVINYVKQYFYEGGKDE